MQVIGIDIEACIASLDDIPLNVDVDFPDNSTFTAISFKYID